MRRTGAVVLVIAGLMASSVLVAPAGSAASSGRALAPAGWEVLDGDSAEAAAKSGGATVTAEDDPAVIAIQSLRNTNFVTAERNYPDPQTGVLRARSTDLGGWENFDLEWDPANQAYALKSQATGLYVAVEKNLTGDLQNALRARSANVGGWERFELLYNEELDHWAIRSKLNGLYVTMEHNYTGTLQYALRARSTSISGSWEQFLLYDRS
ncbi:hypothetical protein [Streptomyces sp. MNU89]|uniref:fascin domain-containing protein n=1 Tax=Streptomyces sp. MNU89 TaxID=2560025 RepID=UPI001E65DB6D|nr:hypothetical protein [Streptomyces sp. MNU89]MCC9738398.1 hypothetical protein [Streptomyces sp. MNU89]